MSKVFVFRVANDRQYVQDEFKQGRLRQGWGDSGTNLNVSLEEWVDKQCQKNPFEGNRAYYTSKYYNLRKMLDINEGDILIVPKIPTSSQFAICKAAGRYQFVQPDGYDGDDFYHMIPIDLESVRVYSYHANEYCENIRAKMRAYQSPVNNVWNKTIQNSADILLTENIQREEASLSAIIDAIKTDCYKAENTLQRFRNLGSHTTEKIVRLIFEKLGYEWISSNSYDKQGGDADLIFKDNSLSEFFEVAANSTEIASEVYVQIKNKNGVDANDIEGVKQLIARTKDIPGATKILISTADKFTEECQELAKLHNILLIDSFGFIKLIFKYID